MPNISLVVCVYNERDLLGRLLRESFRCYDDLVVLHDGEEERGSVKAIAELAREFEGRFYVRPRRFQQEPHWPFAWQQAKYDWILRLDADEFPSQEMKQWLNAFRRSPEPEEIISGYTCIWPLWDGNRDRTTRYASGRIFLLNRQRVRFFGMAEQVPIADGRYLPLELILHHRPARKSYGLGNILFRKQAYRWRHDIAKALLATPTDLNRWRWDDRNWPATWEQIRQHPWLTAVRRLLKSPMITLRDQWRTERKLFPLAALANPLHHALLSLQFWRLRRRERQKRKFEGGVR